MKRIATIAATALVALSLMGSATAQDDRPEFGSNSTSGSIGFIAPGN